MGEWLEEKFKEENKKNIIECFIFFMICLVVVTVAGLLRV